MAQASAMAKYDALHRSAPYHDGTFSSWSATRDAEHPFDYREGVIVWVHHDDLTPDDDFLSGGQSQQEQEGEQGNQGA